MRNHLVAELGRIAAEDERTVLLTADLGYGVLKDFSQQFPERCFNVGICEQNMTAVAAGLALEGRVAYTYSIGNFPVMRCLEQIRNCVCYHNANVKIIAVEPSSSAVLSGGQSGSHGIQGIGAGFIPEILDVNIYDEVIAVSDEDAFKFGRLIGISEGILVGISSGAAVSAAVEIAKRPECKGKNIVVLLPDTGDRYLSTRLFAD